MSERARLFEYLPTRLRRAPATVPTVHLAYSGAGTLTVGVDADAIVCTGVGGAPSGRVPLDGWTVAHVIADLAALGITASLRDASAAAVRAESLIEEPPMAVNGTGIDLGRFTDPNWTVLVPIATALGKAAARIDAAIAQLNLLAASGFFADWWGRLLGVPRHASEVDAAYTARQRREVLRHRDNNFALADVIEQDTPVRVIAVEDLEPLTFRCGTRPLGGHPLRGLYYNACSALVRVDGFPSLEVLAAARANVAGGVAVFVDGIFPPMSVDSDMDLTSGDVQVGTPPYLQISTGTIGVGAIAP